MPGTLQPLDQKFAIVDDQGRPTLYFTQWAQQKQIDITGSAQIDGGNDFTGDQNIDGNLTVTDGGLTLKAVSTSLGFTIADRSTSPGHQINFSSNAPVTAGGAVLNVFAAQSSATKKNLSQISLWTVPPTAVSAVQSAIRASAGASGEEMIFLTQQFGTGVLTAGDIVFKPNNVEKLRILSAAGDPAVKVTGQLSVTDDPYSASWNGSTDVPTKNAVYDKINSLPSGGGGGTPWYFKPPLAANFSTMYASLRAGSILNAFTVTDDADVGMAYVDNSADVGYMKAMGRPIPAAFIGGNFTITARMTANSYTANDQWGIWVRASATKYIFFDLFNRGGTMNIQRAFYNAAWNDGSFTLSWESPEIWLRIVVNNQTTSYWVSADGKHWTQCYASENLFAASFTDYGFCMGRFSTTAKWFITCDSFTSDEYP